MGYVAIRTEHQVIVAEVLRVLCPGLIEVRVRRCSVDWRLTKELQRDLHIAQGTVLSVRSPDITACKPDLHIGWPRRQTMSPLEIIRQWLEK